MAKEKKKFLRFEDVSKYLSYSHKKTDTYYVINLTKGERLGAIQWSGAWRKFVFVTKDNSVLQFDAGCLTEITDFITALMEKRKTQHT